MVKLSCYTTDKLTTIIAIASSWLPINIRHSLTYDFCYNKIKKYSNDKKFKNSTQIVFNVDKKCNDVYFQIQAIDIMILI